MQNINGTSNCVIIRSRQRDENDIIWKYCRPESTRLRAAKLTQRTQNICIAFVQRWPNVYDVGPALYKMLYKCFEFTGKALPLNTGLGSLVTSSREKRLWCRQVKPVPVRRELIIYSLSLRIILPSNSFRILSANAWPTSQPLAERFVQSLQLSVMSDCYRRQVLQNSETNRRTRGARMALPQRRASECEWGSALWQRWSTTPYRYTSGSTSLTAGDQAIQGCVSLM